MSIATTYHLICDQCEEREDFERCVDWTDLMERMKSAGWRSRKMPDESWNHYCSECRY